MATDPNDYPHGNPIFSRGVPALSTNGAQHQQNSKPRVSPAIKKMILELGLRFRPQAMADQQEYTAAVALLAQDLALIPESLLQRAIDEWVRTKRFLPRAAELIELAQGYQRAAQQGSDAALKQLQAHCVRLNALNGGRDGWHVCGDPGSRTIRKRSEAPRDYGQPR